MIEVTKELSTSALQHGIASRLWRLSAPKRADQRIITGRADRACVTATYGRAHPRRADYRFGAHVLSAIQPETVANRLYDGAEAAEEGRREEAAIMSERGLLIVVCGPSAWASPRF